MAASTVDWVPPESFDEYRLVRALGRGGMGQVWLAHDAVLDRLVAVKFIAELQAGDAVRQRFLTEARAAARVQHPNIIAVYRIGEIGPRPYLISEYVRGSSLDKLAKPVPWPRILEIARGLARGLAAAHRRGVLHRDLKPANAILAETGEIKLLDFGLAKLVQQIAPLPAEPLAAEPPRVREAATLPAAAGEPTVALRARSEQATAPPEQNAETLPVAAGARAEKPGRDLTLPAITGAGAVMGTPSYMPPEAWRGEPATPRSDVYSLGALLYELCAGAPPHRGDSPEAVRVAALGADPPPLAAAAPGIDARFAAVVDRCLRREPAERFASGDAVLEALEALAVGDERPAGNPYRGLAAFEASHRRLFFGRDAAIRTVLDRLAADPFVLVAGDSGVGKSSLCRAGVIPRLEEGALGERRIEVVALVPGRRPAGSLAAALAPVLGADESGVLAAMLDDPEELARRLRASLGGGRMLVLFVDQLEELLTLAAPEEAEPAARTLAALVVRSPQLRVLATVRGDYVTRLASLPALAPELERALLLLAPLGPDAIREAVLGPARAAGVRFESEALVDELVAAAAGSGLPLLQFALGELWEARDRETGAITAVTLAALGGVAGALSRHADATLAAMLPGPRAAARAVLVGLVTAEQTRARRTAAELAAGDDARAAIEALVRARLVVAREEAGATAYELAHEALIAEWPALRDWLRDDAGHRVLREQLARAAADWLAQGRPRDALWPARRLAAAGELPPAGLGEAARAFLRASRSAIRRRRAAQIAAVAAVPLIVAAVLAYTQRAERQERERRIRAELTEATAALERARAARTRLDAARGAAYAKFDAEDHAAGKDAWRGVQALAGEADGVYGEASRAVERALILDGAGAEGRALLADIILERALLAESRHAGREVQEMLGRLALYDDDGARRRRWDAPGTLSLATEPPAAEVAIEQWLAEGGGGRWAGVAAAPAPVRERALAPGSYRLRIRAAGRADVTYPVLVGRGERLELAVALPPAAAVPDGFVYLPPARFLSGTTDVDGIWSSYLSAAPIHARTPEHPVLIARRETTYAEWIAFLEALPGPERAQRAPKTASVSMQGSLELLRDAAGRWTLRLQPGPAPYEAAAGAPIVYRDRASGAAQAWERMPVSGVSWTDAKEYAAWLSRSGRVPGARLCRDAEWELAARGADGRPFPAGAELRPGTANMQEAHGGRAAAYGPDEVGSHPASDSPFGIHDMAGNVWELTAGGADGQTPIARGGAFSIDSSSARTELRQVVEPTLRDPTLGLRICADP